MGDLGPGRAPRLGPRGSTAWRRAAAGALGLWLAGAARVAAAPGEDAAPAVEARVVDRDDAAPADPPAAFARAAALEGAGDVRGAVRVIEAAADRFPDDHDLWIRLGWLRLAVGDGEGARRAFARARGLSGGSPASRLGLAFALERLGRCRAALEVLGAHGPPVLDDATADGIVRRCGRETRTWAVARADGGFGSFGGHPFLDWSASALVALDLRVVGRLLVGGAYRHQRFRTRLPAPARADPRVLGQHEVYGHLGGRWRGGALRFVYAWVDDGAADLDWDVHVAGARLDVEAVGDVSLEASASFYPAPAAQPLLDRTVLRLAPAWAVEVAPWLVLVPGGAVQYVDRVVVAAGELSAVLRWASGAVWLGGRLGEQRRPVFLDQPTVYDTPDRVREGGWLGLEVWPSTRVALRAVYEVQRREAPGAGGPGTGNTDAVAHFVVGGFRWATRD